MATSNTDAVGGAPATPDLSDPKTVAAALKETANAYRRSANDSEENAAGLRRRAAQLSCSRFPAERALADTVAVEAHKAAETATAKRARAAAADHAAWNLEVAASA